MTHFKFEGDISDISARQIEYISSVLEERGFSNETVNVDKVGKDGDNYIASVKRITVEKEGNKFKIIAKIAPTAESIRNTMNIVLCFRNEHAMYTEILPKFTELEISAGIPESERLRYPFCYGSFSESPNEIILLEDLTESEFVMLDRFVSLTDDAIKLVLKDFAKLHSYSYALRYQQPETYKTLKSKLINTWTALEHIPDSKLYFQTIEKDLLQIIDNEKYKKAIKGVVGELISLAVKNAKIDEQSKYSVIQQGDSWTNNIMFRLKDEKAVECCMIDYQISKESSPVADIHYLLLNCTDYETRSNHYQEWIDYYHDQLDDCLSNFGLKASLVFPRDQLDTDQRRYGKNSMSLSALLCTVILRESADATKFKEMMENYDENNMNMENMMKEVTLMNMDEKSLIRFKERVEGLIHSCYDIGLL